MESMKTRCRRRLTSLAIVLTPFMRATPKGTLWSCYGFILHKICLHNVVYGCANFSEDILIELLTGNKNGVK